MDNDKQNIKFLVQRLRSFYVKGNIRAMDIADICKYNEGYIRRLILNQREDVNDKEIIISDDIYGYMIVSRTSDEARDWLKKYWNKNVNPRIKSYNKIKGIQDHYWALKGDQLNIDEVGEFRYVEKRNN